MTQKIEYSSDCYIDVLGDDNKSHQALSWHDKTCCGVNIKSKKTKDLKDKNIFSCYECTY